uniref:OCEL domain-containing protein n=1 Tax=Amphilophus citrinellus TaxID=61819 RepID=A0A3Q0SPH1_AMPCI
MSALKENQCYGLSSSKLSRGGNVSVFHVKLTDSALINLNLSISIFFPSFFFILQKITIPCSENRDEVRIFTFGVTNVARDNPHGSFDCIKQLSTSAAEELSCLGVIQKKMTVKATDESYDKARQSMAQAEEETRSRGAIVIKHGGRYQGKKVTVRAPAPALARLAKPKHSSLLSNIKKGVGASTLKKDACASNRRSTSDLQERPLRERIMHLLALRPYKRPELILRLQKDGLTAGDKNVLDSVLMELNSRDSTFVLKDSLYKELQKDWPGYTSGDQQLLKRILVRRLFQPQQNLLTVPEAQVSPLRDTPNSSPAHRPKHSLPEEYTDPLATKKPRISHLSSKTASDKSRTRSSEQAHKDVTADDRQRDSLDPQKLIDSLSAVCQQEEKVAKRLEPPHAVPKGPEIPEDHPQPNSDRPQSPLIVPDLTKHAIKKKKSKHKHGDHVRKLLLICLLHHLFELGFVMVRKGCFVLIHFIPYPPPPPLHRKYTVIYSHEQRQSYKQDFNKEYDEYRDLHSRIDSVTQQFMDLDTQLKQLHHESHKYKTVRNQILQEYRKIKKCNPNYSHDKVRCEYLHNKLAHIKKLISEYDQQQLSVECASLN